MAKYNEFVEYIKEILEPFGIINARAMFGGFGIYKDGVIFGMIIDNELYFKVDEMLAEFFQKSGSEFFTYETNGKKVKMSYSKVPEEILENSESLKEWAELSFNIAVKSKIKKNGL